MKRYSPCIEGEYQGISMCENPDGKYVLASEAANAVVEANAAWLERCRKFRAADAAEAKAEAEQLQRENEDFRKRLNTPHSITLTVSLYPLQRMR